LTLTSAILLKNPLLYPLNIAHPHSPCFSDQK
jgi:hypothetical protein